MGDSPPKPKGSRRKACKGCSLNTLWHQLRALNCHLMLSAGRSWVCDRDGDSGFNVWVAVTLNITRTTHIKPVGILVTVTAISLSSHYAAFPPSACVLSHMAALPPTKQHSSQKQVLVNARHAAAWICLSFSLKDTVPPFQTIFHRWNSACVWNRRFPSRDLRPIAGLVWRSSDKDLGGHLQPGAAPEDVLWLLAQPVVWHHHPRLLKLMSACTLQQLRNQHTFASAVSPPWWPFLADRQRGQLEVAASQTTPACIARAYHLCTERTPAKVVAWLYNFACGWSGKIQKNSAGTEPLTKRT